MYGDRSGSGYSNGKVAILKMLNVHDSGTIINPLLAQGQVEGGNEHEHGYGA